MNKDFIQGAESIIDLVEEKLNGELCHTCQEKSKSICETIREKIRKRKLTKLEIELDI